MSTNRLFHLLIVAVLVVVIPLTACAPKAPPTQPTVTLPPPRVTQLSPASTSTKTPLPPITFTSPRYGYSITIPAGWTIQEIPGQWDGTTTHLKGDPGMDVFYRFANDDFPDLEIGFLPVQPGTTLESWAPSVAWGPKFSDCKVTPLEPNTVAGLPALMQHQEPIGCGQVTPYNMFLVQGGQGIFIQWLSRGTPTSMDILASILGTLKLP